MTTLRIECWNCGAIVEPDSQGYCPQCEVQFPRFAMKIRILPETTPEVEQKLHPDPIKRKEAELAAEYYEWLHTELLPNQAIQPSDYTLPDDRPAIGWRTIQSQIPEEERQFKAVFKVVIMGTSDSGKEESIFKIAGTRFSEDYRQIFGFDISGYDVQIDKRLFKLLIWDIINQHIRRELMQKYCQGLSGALFFYNLASRPSYEKLLDYIETVNKAARIRPVPGVIIGNWPNPTQPRQITSGQGQALASKHHLHFYELPPNPELALRILKNIFQDLAQDMYQQLIKK